MVMTYRENGKLTKATPNPRMFDGVGPPTEHAIYYNRDANNWAIGYVDDDNGLFIQRVSAATEGKIKNLMWTMFTG